MIDAMGAIAVFAGAAALGMVLTTMTHQIGTRGRESATRGDGDVKDLCRFINRRDVR